MAVEDEFVHVGGLVSGGAVQPQVLEDDRSRDRKDREKRSTDSYGETKASQPGRSVQVDRQNRLTPDWR